MGNLAAFGIAGGRKVPTGGLLQQRESGLDDPFTAKAIKEAGFLDIARKLQNHQELSVDEIEQLYKNASIAVLLKLVGWKDCLRPQTDLTPIVYLPFENWISALGVDEALERSLWFLEQIDHEDFRVILDGLDYSRLNSGLSQLLLEISSCRPGITLVGPSAESIMTWLSGEARFDKLNALRTVRLIRLLGQMKAAGVLGLRPSTVPSMIKIIHEVGLDVPLMTPVDCLSSAREFAELLVRINSISGNARVIKSWTPGLAQIPRKRMPRAVKDNLLLRAIAVGTLCLDNVPFIRGSSRHLSLDGVRMAGLFGANDRGVGAINAETAERLNILPHEVLLNATAPPTAWRPDLVEEL